jgi:hypothetical protein
MTALEPGRYVIDSIGTAEEVGLRCIRKYLGTATRSSVESALDREIDWDRFDRIAHSHHVRPLVYRVLLDGHTESVPAEVLDRWRSYIQRNAKRNLYLTGELATLLGEFDGRDIPALPFKGPVLAARAYEDVTLREFADLDIIIEEADFGRAKSVLRNRGYDVQYKIATEEDVTPTQEELILEFGRECEFYRADDRVPVDLHWRFLPRRSSFPLSFDDIRARRDSITVAGKAFPTLSVEDTLLLLGVHGTRHCWRHARETCDLAALVTNCRIDWETVIDRATALGCRRRLGIGLQLARHLLDIEVPERVVDRLIVSDPEIPTLVQGAYDRLFGSRSKSASGTMRYKYAAHERVQDRLTFLLYWGFYPGRKEVEWIALPDRLRRLYHVLRPVRLLKDGYERESGDREV